MKLFDQLHDYIGEKANGTSYQIDIVNYCPLRCPSCALGSIGTNRKGIMSFDTFRRLLDRAESYNKIRHVRLYTYSDAAMHPQLDLFISECSKRGIKTWLSTMCQTTKCDWEKVIEAKPYEVRISFPGWEKMHYFQKNAKPEIFDRNVDKLCALPRYPETVWTLAWHYYRTNAHEESRARALAERYKLKFVRLPSIFMPLERYVEGNYSSQDKELMTHLWETPEEAAKTMKRTSVCTQWKSFCIDANADVYLCELIFEDRFKVGNFFDVELPELKRRIKTHPFCGQCLAKGGNVLQACYSEMASSQDPIGDADKKRRLQ